MNFHTISIYLFYNVSLNEIICISNNLVVLRSILYYIIKTLPAAVHVRSCILLKCIWSSINFYAFKVENLHRHR